MRPTLILLLLAGLLLANAPVARGEVDPLRLRVLVHPSASPVAKGETSPVDRLAQLLAETGPVRLRSLGLPGAGAAKLAGAEAGSARARLRRWVELFVESPSEREEAWARLRASGMVERIEPVETLHTAAIPDDPLRNIQRHLEQIGLDEAWDRVRGDQGDVVIAVVDGGTLYTHVDLGANLWINPGEIEGNGIDDDGNGYVDDIRGWNFALGTGDPLGLPHTPFSELHGTHIAGIVSAVTDNGVGIAGGSYNARYMAVNVNHPEIDNNLVYGFDGILYAAASGADIINASWGRRGRWSQYEADLLAAVAEMGSLVVAAAGNDGSLELEQFTFYPAFYPHVLSVASVDTEQPVRSFYSNYDYWIDVSAPGRRIWSTLPGDVYERLSGTSQAAAVTSALAALLKTQHPSWGPEEITQQLRWTTTSLDETNPGLEQKLGTGLISARDAVTATPPGLCARNLRLVDEDGDGQVERGEVVNFAFDLHNHLRDVSPVRVHLEVGDAPLVPLETTLLLGRVASGVTLPVQRGLSAWIPYDLQLGELSSVRLVCEADGRRSHDAFTLEVLPIHHTLTAARLELSLAASGKIGYSDVVRGRDPGGVGLRRPGGGSRLLGGGLLVGDGPDRVSDAVASARPIDSFEDFHPIQGQERILPERPRADQEILSVFSDRAAARRLGVRVEQAGLAYRDAERGGFVLVAYEVQAELDPLQGVRLGVLVDWDLGQGAEQLRFDPELRMLWAEDPEGEGELAGVAIVEGAGEATASWLYNLEVEGYDGPTLYHFPDLERKLSDSELWSLMEGSALGFQSPVGAMAGVLSCGTSPLEVGERTRLVVAFVVADDEAELRAEMDAARIAWEGVREGVTDGLPPRARLLSNVPNPFNPRTVVRFSLPEAGRVRLTIYDARGRVVRRLADDPFAAGFHRVEWQGVDDAGRAVASGVYHLLLESDRGEDRRKLTLIR